MERKQSDRAFKNRSQRRKQRTKKGGRGTLLFCASMPFPATKYLPLPRASPSN